MERVRIYNMFNYDRKYCELVKREGETEQYFYTKKDKKEIGYLDEKENIFYINDDYKENTYIKRIVKDILRDYNVKETSEYINVRCW